MNRGSSKLEVGASVSACCCRNSLATGGGDAETLVEGAVERAETHKTHVPELLAAEPGKCKCAVSMAAASRVSARQTIASHRCPAFGLGALGTVLFILRYHGGHFHSPWDQAAQVVTPVITPAKSTGGNLQAAAGVYRW